MRSDENSVIEIQGIKIPVIATGMGWLAVNKPPGLSIHNNPGKDLCSFISEYLSENSELGEKVGYNKRFGVSAVHRLDSETSGTVLLGCDKDVLAWFSRQFEQRKVKKKYIALVHGDLEKGEGGDFKWDTPLTPKAEGRKNPTGKGKKVPCVTGFKVLDKSSHYTLIECEPVTGRKHQIRRHAKLSGHPIVGDSRYGSVRALDFLKSNFSWTRLCLHSLSLEITTPDDKSRVVLSSEIPSEIIDLFENDKEMK